MPQEKEQHSPLKKPVEKPVLKKPLSNRQRAALKERAWADRIEETTAEPYEETYRDGSTKNECW